MRASRLIAVVLVVALLTASVRAGTHGKVQVPRVNDGRISVDGSFSDWPLASFTTPSQQPEWPDGQGAEETDALGDHILFEPDRALYFGQGGNCHDGPCAVLNNAPGDFGSVLYMTYDSDALYFLGVFLDDFLQDAMDNSEFGDQAYLNDGFEIFMDVYGDSEDGVTELGNPPNSQFDDEEPNLDDFQISFALNENFDTGARQHMERSGRPGLIGSLGPGEPYESFDDIVVGERNGPGGIYRDALDAFGQNVVATVHDDMRAIGAPNPEIAENPDVTFNGYVLEAAVPFGFADLDDDGQTDDDFVPVEGKEMGFSVFWNDTDGDTDEEFGVDLITRILWTQGGVFSANTWGTLELVGRVGPDGDYNGNGELDAGDLDVQAQYMKDGDPAGDLNGDGVTNFSDRLEWIKTLQNSWVGDSDFNGEFNSSDLVVVFTAGKYEKNEMATYAEGDWDGNMQFNSGDLVAAFTDGGYELGPPAAAAVPEPSGVFLLSLGLLGLGLRRRKG